MFYGVFFSWYASFCGGFWDSCSVVLFCSSSINPALQDVEKLFGGGMRNDFRIAHIDGKDFSSADLWLNDISDRFDFR